MRIEVDELKTISHALRSGPAHSDYQGWCGGLADRIDVIIAPLLAALPSSGGEEKAGVRPGTISDWARGLREVARDMTPVTWPHGEWIKSRAGEIANFLDRLTPPPPAAAEKPAEKLSPCWCKRCDPNPRFQRMVLCPDCGNKRCPKAEYHGFYCTHSNEPNQVGILDSGGPATRPASEPTYDRDKAMGAPFPSRKTEPATGSGGEGQVEPPSVYHRRIEPDENGFIDLFAIADAYGVTCNAAFHAAKKILLAGARGTKDAKQDLEEARQSLQRSIELL